MIIFLKIESGIDTALKALQKFLILQRGSFKEKNGTGNNEAFTMT